MSKDLVWVTFMIEISDSEYSYKRENMGKGELKVNVTRALLENLDAGNLLSGLLTAALVDYDKPKETESEK